VSEPSARVPGWWFLTETADHRLKFNWRGTSLSQVWDLSLPGLFVVLQLIVWCLSRVQTSASPMDLYIIGKPFLMTTNLRSPVSRGFNPKNCVTLPWCPFWMGEISPECSCQETFRLRYYVSQIQRRDLSWIRSWSTPAISVPCWLHSHRIRSLNGTSPKLDKSRPRRKWGYICPVVA
jgi:hypothetical protein